MFFNKTRKAVKEITEISHELTTAFSVALPPRKLVGIIVTPFTETSNLYSRFKAMQHEADWKVIRSYDTDWTQRTGLIYFDMPTQKAVDTLNLLAREYGLELQQLYV